MKKSTKRNFAIIILIGIVIGITSLPPDKRPYSSNEKTSFHATPTSSYEDELFPTLDPTWGHVSLAPSELTDEPIQTISPTPELEQDFEYDQNLEFDQDPDPYTVYRGKTGTKYHRESCPSLKGKGIPISLDEALDQGREPCKICKPD